MRSTCFRKARPKPQWRLAADIFRDAREIVRVLFLGATSLTAAIGYAGSTIAVQLHAGVSNPIYVNAGPVTIDYSYRLAYAGRTYATGGGPGDGASGSEGASILVYSNSGQVIATLLVGVNSFGDSASGMVIWDNPADQYIRLSGDIFVLGYGDGAFENWNITQGSSIAAGGDTPPGGPNTPPTVTQPTPAPTVVQSAPTSSPNSNSSAPLTRTNIHAVIISGLPDPAKVITSPNVTLTGGIAALGRDNAPPSAPSAWSPGLQIIPDYALLTGEKIPPVTPNIIDVRIVRHEVTADFPSPNPQPSN